MAKGPIDDVAFYGGIGFGSFLLYKLARNGSLGTALQTSANSIHTALLGGRSAGGSPGTSPAGGSSAAVSPSQYSPALQGLVAANPNFISQVALWRSERRANGEDPNDWQALEAHESGINAPDPGSTPPPEWPNSPLFGGPMSSASASTSAPII